MHVPAGGSETILQMYDLNFLKNVNNRYMIILDIEHTLENM